MILEMVTVDGYRENCKNSLTDGIKDYDDFAPFGLQVPVSLNILSLRFS